MFKRTTALLTSIFLLFAPALYASDAIEGQALRTILSSQKGSDSYSSQILSRSADGSRGIEKLQGESARAHVRNLKAKRPSHFERSESALLARGFTKTENVTVLRSVSLVNGVPVGRGDTNFAETGFYSGDGEVVLWSWDDGDDATWEGEIYMAAYNPEADLLLSVQADISSSTQITALWAETQFINPPATQEYQTASLNTGFSRGPDIACGSADVVAKIARRATTSGVVFADDPAPKPKTPWEIFEAWGDCTLAACAGAAVACALSGPGWPECWAAWCNGGAVACAVGVALAQKGARHQTP